MSMPGEERPVVAIVTRYWGGSEDEPTEVLRLLAGAVARNAKVHVVHLDGSATVASIERDSVFVVHHLPLRGAAPEVVSVLRGAIALSGRAMPSALATTARALEGQPEGLIGTLREIDASTVVLAGLPIPGIAELMDTLAARRLVLWPMLNDLDQAADSTIKALLARADAIGTLHPGEQQALATIIPERRAKVRPLDIALTLNRSATEQGLFGVGWFGRYVLVIRRFPKGGARFDRSVTHELVRSVLGDIAVAEVDGTRWRVSDFGNTAQLPVNPTRVNLWRLMAHAEFTLDLRPATPFGREAIESILFSSPPIVPEGSAAHAHVEQANGGLWYRTPGELLDLSSTLLDSPDLLRALRSDGLRYASEHHEKMDDFVSRTRELVLG